MKRISNYIIACLLALSTICSLVCLRFDESENSILTDQSAESELEIEAIDFRHVHDGYSEGSRFGLADEKEQFCYSEELKFRNFPEVPFPPPKG